MVRAVLNDALGQVTFRKDPIFGFEVPTTAPGVDEKLLDPRSCWANPTEYDETYEMIAKKFQANFQQFRNLVRPEVAQAGP